MLALALPQEENAEDLILENIFGVGEGVPKIYEPLLPNNVDMPLPPSGLLLASFYP